MTKIVTLADMMKICLNFGFPYYLLTLVYKSDLLVLRCATVHKRGKNYVSDIGFFPIPSRPTSKIISDYKAYKKPIKPCQP